MGFTAVALAVIGKYITASKFNAVVSNQTEFNIRTSVGVGVPPNGSFEFDLDLDGEPDGWTWTPGTNGAIALEDSAAVHGELSAKITRTSGGSNSGGILETPDFIPVAPGTYTLDYWYAADAAIESVVSIAFYDKNQSLVGSPDILMTTSLSQSFRNHRFTNEIPIADDARFCKLFFHGATTTLDVAGSAYFDGITFTQSPNYPVYDGEDYSTFTTGYTTIFSQEVYVGNDASTFAVTVLMTRGTTGNMFYRAILGAATGTENEEGGTVGVFSSHTSTGTVDAGDKDDIVTLQIQGKRVNDNGTIRMTSDVSNGEEGNILIAW